jgi:carbon-monoxide dehydrogenase medium subunit
LPGVAVTCAGDITLFGPAGSRTVRAGDFFTGPLSTLRHPDEIVTLRGLPDSALALGISADCR